MTTTRTRSAASVAVWLAYEANSGGGSTPTPVGAATISDDGTTATITYTMQARISHERMIDLLEETR